MKQFFFFSFLFCFYFGSSQVYQNTIFFYYDAAGNQTVRVLPLNFLQPPGDVDAAEIRNSSEIKEEELLKFFPEDVISYYPNPVKEELFLKWDLINNNSVSTIEIYSFSGQIVKTLSKLEKENSKTISFQEYPAGTYSVLLSYTNGEQKSITIIKQ